MFGRSEPGRKCCFYSHELTASHGNCMAAGFVGAATLRATGEKKHPPHVLALLMFSRQNSNCQPGCLQKKYFKYSDTVLKIDVSCV